METNKKQTAVGWLKDQIIDNKDIYIEGNTLMIPNDIFRKAQQMEREQMIDFYDSAIGACISNCSSISETEQLIELNGNQYYEDTYGK